MIWRKSFAAKKFAETAPPQRLFGRFEDSADVRRERFPTVPIFFCRDLGKVA
jgi:hypothetical protein